jgi:hypothetical protein
MNRILLYLTAMAFMRSKVSHGTQHTDSDDTYCLEIARKRVLYFSFIYVSLIPFFVAKHIIHIKIGKTVSFYLLGSVILIAYALIYHYVIKPVSIEEVKAFIAKRNGSFLSKLWIALTLLSFVAWVIGIYFIEHITF